MKNYISFGFIWCILLLFGAYGTTVYALDAVASIKVAQGQVMVERHAKRLAGRTGLILNDKDVIVTGVRAKVTIIFRDGSVIRLFPKTRFVIDKSAESTSGSRRFINNLLLKWGSFWGKFTKGRQQTTVRTPTATAGIKGTVVSFSEQQGQFSASLTAGAISVKNEDQELLLEPGYQIQNVAKTGDLKSKVHKIPYEIKVETGTQKIVIPKGKQAEKIFFTLQLVNGKTNSNVHKAGEIYIHSSHDKIVFPDNIRLNSRGYARVSAEVKPFSAKDYGNGTVEIHVIMESHDFLNVGAGMCLLSYDPPVQRTNTIRIDVKSGDLTR